MTSGISYYQLTRDQIATAALRKLGVLAEGQAPSAQNLADAAIALNGIIALFRTKGMSLWARSEYTFTPTTGTYAIGIGQTLNTAFPVKLLQAYRTENNTKIDMEIVAKQDFNILPNGSNGSPIKINYTPGINVGTLFLWPIPTSTNTATVTLVYQRPFDYTLTSTDTFDFPEEWYLAITYQLAVTLAPEWSVPLQDRQMLRTEAEGFLAAALEGGQEGGSFFLQPSRE